MTLKIQTSKSMSLITMMRRERKKLKKKNSFLPTMKRKILRVTQERRYQEKLLVMTMVKSMIH